jgi:hypothetical protein
MSELRHAARANKFVKEATFKLGDTALAWQQDGQSGQIAYADVREVTLNPDLSLSSKQAQCVLRDSKGREVTLTSHHFEGLGNFKNRSATYTPFVRALLQRVAAASPGAKFTSGSTSKLMMALALAFIFAVLFSLLIMAQLGAASISNGVIIVVFVATVFAPAFWYAYKGGGTRIIDPADPPPKLIGDHAR